MYMVSYKVKETDGEFQERDSELLFHKDESGLRTLCRRLAMHKVFTT